MKASTTDLRLRAPALFCATDRGEQVIITWRGKPRAKLVPLSEDKTKPTAEHNPAFGLWADRASTQSVEQQVRELRNPRSFE